MQLVNGRIVGKFQDLVVQPFSLVLKLLVLEKWRSDDEPLSGGYQSWFTCRMLCSLMALHFLLTYFCLHLLRCLHGLVFCKFEIWRDAHHRGIYNGQKLLRAPGLQGVLQNLLILVLHSRHTFDLVPQATNKRSHLVRRGKGSLRRDEVIIIITVVPCEAIIISSSRIQMEGVIRSVLQSMRIARSSEMSKQII